MAVRESTSEVPSHIYLLSGVRAHRRGPVDLWLFLAVAIFGCLAVLVGRYEPVSRYSPLSLVMAVLLLLSFFFMTKRVVGKRAADSSEQASLALLACALLWIFFRAGRSYAPQVIILPALFWGWLFVTLSPRVLILPLAAVVLMEGGLWAGGFQKISALAGNLAACALAALSFLIFVKSRTYFRRIRREAARARKAETDRAWAKDLGLLPTNPHVLASLPGPEVFSDPEAEARSAASRIDEGFAAQLELTRHALAASSAALLWPGTEGREYRLRAIATVGREINPGPYPIGAGITGALLKSSETVSLAPVPPSFGALPYYRKQVRVGAVLAVRLPENGSGANLEEGRRFPPILCADRSEPRPWTEEEKRTLSLAARKLALDVIRERHCQAMAREHGALQRVCVALRELNGVADLDQVLRATVKAVRFLAQVDFVAISLVQGNRHKVAWVEGAGAEKLLGRTYPLEEGLVGSALKLNCPLPSNARGHAPIQLFGKDFLLTGYASLLIVPLQREEGSAVGALTLAARSPGALNPAREEILRLITAQVAVKIDLGRTHQQLNQLATTDSLTGLLNHRTFQHGLHMMLQRESRRQGCLTLFLLDIDYFKKINDTYGHPFGDTVLQGVARILDQAARQVDLTARYGGDEFALVLEGADLKGALQVAARIRKEIEGMVFPHDQGSVRITTSLGLVVSPRHGTDKSILLSRADQALYEAKRQGRNRVVVWGQE